MRETEHHQLYMERRTARASAWDLMGDAFPLHFQAFASLYTLGEDLPTSRFLVKAYTLVLTARRARYHSRAAGSRRRHHARTH